MSLSSLHSWRRRLLFLLLGASTVAAAGRAAGAAPDEAARVIARYVEVTGGAEAFARELTLYTHATVEAFGFKGVLESWNAKPDRHHGRTELGPFKLSEGTSGAASWRTDPTTGRVVTLTDRDSLEALESMWFAFERWAEPGGAGGTVTVAGHESDSTGRYTVLSITAPGGAKAHRLWFADADGLLAREEAAHDQTMAITLYEDWRMMAGRRRALVTRLSLPSMPANRLVTRADSFAVNADMSDVSFSPPGAGGGNALHWLGAGGRVTLPFDYRSRHVWIKASIDGGPEQDFVFDTGASVTVMDSTFVAKHGLEVSGFMQAAGAGAAGSASFATLGSLRLSAPDGAGVELRDLKVAVMNVTPAFSRYFWGEFAGIVGYDVISRFVTTIDYDRRELVLNDPHTFAYSGTEAPLTMKLNGVVPSIDATLDGRERGEFRLDVGSSSTVDLHAPFAKRHGIERRLRHARAVTGAGFGGQFDIVLGRLKTMAIGPYTWKEPMVSVSHATEGAFASEDFAGNIGNRILERFRVTLDYEHRRLWLEPGRRYRDRDAFTRTGMLLGWSPTGIDALAVLSGSPAARAGLREGDHVEAVDGRPMDQWALAAVDSLFEAGPDGRRVALAIRRGEERRTLTLVLREMLK